MNYNCCGTGVYPTKITSGYGKPATSCNNHDGDYYIDLKSRLVYIYNNGLWGKYDVGNLSGQRVFVIPKDANGQNTVFLQDGVPTQFGNFLSQPYDIIVSSTSDALTFSMQDENNNYKVINTTTWECFKNDGTYELNVASINSSAMITGSKRSMTLQELMNNVGKPTIQEVQSDDVNDPNVTVQLELRQDPNDQTKQTLLVKRSERNYYLDYKYAYTKVNGYIEKFKIDDTTYCGVQLVKNIFLIFNEDVMDANKTWGIDKNPFEIKDFSEGKQRPNGYADITFAGYFLNGNKKYEKGIVNGPYPCIHYIAEDCEIRVWFNVEDLQSQSVNGTLWATPRFMRAILNSEEVSRWPA